MENIAAISDDLKNFSMPQLMKAMQTASAPQYLVLSEITDRKKRQAMAGGNPQDQASVKDQVMRSVNAAGIGALPARNAMNALAPNAMAMKSQNGSMEPTAMQSITNRPTPMGQQMGQQPGQQMGYAKGGEVMGYAESGGIGRTTMTAGENIKNDYEALLAYLRSIGQAPEYGPDVSGYQPPAGFDPRMQAQSGSGINFSTSTPPDAGLLPGRLQRAGMGQLPNASVGPEAMSQMIDGPMSGVPTGIGDASLELPDRLMAGLRGGGGSDWTPRPDTPPLGSPTGGMPVIDLSDGSQPPQPPMGGDILYPGAGFAGATDDMRAPQLNAMEEPGANQSGTGNKAASFGGPMPWYMDPQQTDLRGYPVNSSIPDDMYYSQRAEQPDPEMITPFDPFAVDGWAKEPASVGQEPKPSGGGLSFGLPPADTGALPRMPGDPALSFGVIDEPTTDPESSPPGGTQRTSPSQDGAGGAGSSPSGGIFAEYEGMLRQRMDDITKGEEQQKWLTIAKLGLGLMESKAPTLGMAMGEAGMAALEDYEAMKANNSGEMWKLQETMMGLKLKQADAVAKARAAASGGGSGSGSGIGETSLELSAGEERYRDAYLEPYNTKIKNIQDEIAILLGNELGVVDEDRVAQLRQEMAASLQARDAANYEFTINRRLGTGYDATQAPTQAAPPIGITGLSMGVPTQ